MLVRNKKIQGFIEQYYPNYHTCKWVKEDQDLYKIISGDFKEGDELSKIVKEKYDGDLYNLQLQIDEYQSYTDILEKAIEEYIKQSPK